MSTIQLTSGTLVDGRFTVGTLVRQRDGVVVYEATDSKQAGTVSLTLYDGSCFPSGLVRERSLRELRQLQSIRSPRVVGLKAAGKFAEGIYEATDVLPTQTLAEHLSSAPMALADAAAIAVQVGEALLEAQRVGVIHRSLGGDVIFPSPEGVKVAGFAVGIPQGDGFGPVYTIAPEQVQGKVVDQRTLIYNVAALMHWMLSGAPLFGGAPADVREAHVNQEVPGAVDSRLQRALGKDPRMRPMMLKQFLGEIATMGGVEPPKLAARMAGGAQRVAPAVAAPSVAPAAAKPSSRGWTMFMKVAEEEPATPTAPTAPTADAPAEAAQVDAAPSVVAKPKTAGTGNGSAGDGGQASTRGWTMFMPAQPEGDGATDTNAEAQPADSAEAAETTASAQEGEQVKAKPTTRGWTMFMNEAGGAADAAVPETADAVRSDAGVPDSGPSPSAVAAPTVELSPKDTSPTRATGIAPPPAYAGAQSEASAVAEGEKKGRGWTMFTKDTDAADTGLAPPAATAPATRTVETPIIRTVESPPGESPATRTVQTPVSAAPTVGSSQSSTPNSRGWTMFMDKPGGDPKDGASQAPGPEADPVAAAAAPTTRLGPGGSAVSGSAVSGSAVSGSAASGSAASGPAAASPVATGSESEKPKKRGWTMFMEAPIKDLAPPASSGTAGASDKKGWTVFGEAAGESPAQPGKPALPDTLVVTPEASAGGVASGSSSTRTAPLGPRPELSEDPQRSKTVVAAGLISESGAAGSITGRVAEQVAPPDTMYFKRGETEPDAVGNVARPATARDVVPIGVRPVEELHRGHTGGAPAMPTPNVPATQSSGSKLPLILGGVAVAVGGVVAAYLALT